jgi:phosphate transport system substrate-binding protein
MSDGSFIINCPKIITGFYFASGQPNWGFQVFAALNQDSAIAPEVQRVDGAIVYIDGVQV